MTRIQHFQKYQHYYEVAFVAAFVILNSMVLATSRIMDDQRRDPELPYQMWEPFLWEFSSSLTIILLVPGVIWLVWSKHSIWSQPKKALLVFLAASLIFSILHVTGMVAIRELVYWSQGMEYTFGNVAYEFIYEYRKDFVTFILLVAILHGYRFLVSRLYGEANIVSNGEDNNQLNNYDRLLVKKLGKEFIVKISDVEWLESSGNYVNLHVAGRIYPTRNTLAKLIDEISDKGFCRVHRSYAVNLDAVDSIESHASGSGEVTLKNGKVLNLSRRYHNELKQRCVL